MINSNLLGLFLVLCHRQKITKSSSIFSAFYINVSDLIFFFKVVVKQERLLHIAVQFIHCTRVPG